MNIINHAGRAYPNLSDYPNNINIWAVLVQPIVGLPRVYVGYIEWDEYQLNPEKALRAVANKGRHTLNIREINLFFPTLTEAEID